MFAVIGVIEALVAVNTGMLPEPLAMSPIDVLSLVQENVVPVTGPEKFITEVGDPLQTDIFPGCVTDAIGFIVIVNIFCGPVQVTPPFE